MDDRELRERLETWRHDLDHRLRSKVSCPQHRKEIVQETLARYLKRYPLAQSPPDEPWVLHGIAQRVVWELYRTQERDRTRAERQAGFNLVPMDQPLPPEEAYERDRQGERCFAALATLTELRQLLVIAIDLEDMTLEEAATLLDISCSKALRERKKAHLQLAALLEAGHSKEDSHD